MMRFTLRSILLASVLGGLFLSGPAAAPVRAAEPGAKTVVKMGVVSRPDQAPFEIAYRRGYFERRGIVIDPVPASSGQEFASALATEQIQVATGVPNAALFNALNRGIGIKIVADFAHLGDEKDRTVSIVVRSPLYDSGQVKTPADLKGRVINEGPFPGQYPDVLWSKVLALGHLSESDVTLTHVGFSDALGAMGSGKVDAAFMIEPLVTQADKQNIARVMLPAGAVDSGAELSIVLFSPSFAQNADAGARFLAAFLEGARDYYDAFFLNKNRDDVVKLVTTYLSVKDPALWATARQATDLNGQVNVADLKRQAAFFKQQGTLSGPIPDIDANVDKHFAEDAVKLIGKR
jgi:NitT/TauT family transport system substrate-binding protein